MHGALRRQHHLVRPHRLAPGGSEGSNVGTWYACKPTLSSGTLGLCVQGHSAWSFLRWWVTLAWSMRGSMFLYAHFVFNSRSFANRQATINKLEDKFNSWEEDQYKPALSILFNIFICTQVGYATERAAGGST